MKFNLCLLIGAAALVCLSSAASAANVTKGVQTHCVHDYRAYCSDWGLQTRGLKHCMRKHGDRLNPQCVAALVQAGEVSQAEIDARKKK